MAFHRRLVALVALVTCLGVLASAAGASARKPVIVSLSVTPSMLPSSGGGFTISGRVRRSVSCTIFYYDGRLTKHTVNCSSGRLSYRRHAPANSTTETARWSVWIEAHSGHQNTQSWEVAVEVLPSAPTPPPVKGLDACTAGPHCDYGYAYESFQTWGNVAPDTLGDCTFAAAANWEQIILGIHPDPTVIGYEFAQAGGTAERGLPQNSLWTYWQKYGIAGTYLTGLHRYLTDQTDVENAVRDFGALVVQLDFVSGGYFAQYPVSTGSHDAVVDGFTPEGPLVVTWGETVQMTWEQWNDEIVGMWGIGAAKP